MPARLIRALTADRAATNMGQPVAYLYDDAENGLDRHDDQGDRTVFCCGSHAIPAHSKKEIEASFEE